MTRWVNANTYPTPSDPFGTATQEALNMEVLGTVSSPTPSSTSGFPRYGVANGSDIYAQTNGSYQDHELTETYLVLEGADGASTTSQRGRLCRTDYYDQSGGNDYVINKIVARVLEPWIVVGGTMQGAEAVSKTQNLSNMVTARFKNSVRFYEILNEPDLNGFTPAVYVQHLRAAYQIIKAADTDAVVVIGGHHAGYGGSFTAWAQGIYDTGARGTGVSYPAGPKCFDMWSAHPYRSPPGGITNDGTWQQLFTNPTSVRSIMDANGDSNVLIAVTETGFRTPDWGDLPTQTQTYRDILGWYHTQPRTGPLFFYTMTNGPNATHFGMLDDTGTNTTVVGTGRRPAWSVYHDYVVANPNG